MHLCQKYNFLKRKKNSRYKTLYDILKEKKNQGKKNLDETNKKNNLELNNLNDSSTYQYGIKDENLLSRIILILIQIISKMQIIY